MRYDYRCEDCGAVREIIHPMTVSPLHRCPECQGRMRIVIGPPILIHVTHGSGVQGRSLLSPDRPTNAEYSAYQAWERSGGEPGTKEHKNYLHVRGELK